MTYRRLIFAVLIVSPIFSGSSDLSPTCQTTLQLRFLKLTTGWGGFVTHGRSGYVMTHERRDAAQAVQMLRGGGNPLPAHGAMQEGNLEELEKQISDEWNRALDTALEMVDEGWIGHTIDWSAVQEAVTKSGFEELGITDAEYICVRGRLWEVHNRYEDAENHYIMALDLQPTNVHVLVTYGGFIATSMNHSSAEEWQKHIEETMENRDEDIPMEAWAAVCMIASHVKESGVRTEATLLKQWVSAAAVGVGSEVKVGRDNGRLLSGAGKGRSDFEPWVADAHEDDSDMEDTIPFECSNATEVSKKIEFGSFELVKPAGSHPEAKSIFGTSQPKQTKLSVTKRAEGQNYTSMVQHRDHAANTTALQDNLVH